MCAKLPINTYEYVYMYLYASIIFLDSVLTEPIFAKYPKQENISVNFE